MFLECGVTLQPIRNEREIESEIEVPDHVNVQDIISYTWICYKRGHDVSNSSSLHYQVDNINGRVLNMNMRMNDVNASLPKRYGKCIKLQNFGSVIGGIIM